VPLFSTVQPNWYATLFFMQAVRIGFGNFLETRRAKLISLIVALLLFFITCLIQNGSSAFEVFTFYILPFYKRIGLFFFTLFDLTPFGYGVLSVTIVSATLGGISAGLLYSYYTIRNAVLNRGGLALSGGAYALALLGMQCTACGTALLTGLLTLMGGVWLNTYLPLHGLEIGILGIVLQAVLITSLTTKLAYPTTC